MTEAIWPATPKILTVWLFIEKVCWPLIKTKEEQRIYLIRQGTVTDCYYHESKDQAHLFPPPEADSFKKSKLGHFALLLKNFQWRPIPPGIKPKDPVHSSSCSSPGSLQAQIHRLAVPETCHVHPASGPSHLLFHLSRPLLPDTCIPWSFASFSFLLKVVL